MRRTWLLGRLSGHLEFERREIEAMLVLDDQELIALAAEHSRRELIRELGRYGDEQARLARREAEVRGLELICRCDELYPHGLRRLQAPPAVLHVAGGMGRFLELAADDPVAVVGTRRPTSYGLEVAEMLGRGVSVAGLTLVSGMALGIDSAAHRGSLAGGGRTIAVLAGCAADPYPRRNRKLYGEILRDGVAVSELGVGASLRKWTFVARNRVIAALSRMTIVVQGLERSGALKTAEFAQELGREVGAVPGSVQVRQSRGPHRLLREGAVLIGGPQDVLDAVFGAGVRDATEAERAALPAEQQAVLDGISDGADTIAALTRSGISGDQVLRSLAELELTGMVRRAAGGRYVIVA
jgi:DNA processing protein